MKAKCKYCDKKFNIKPSQKLNCCSRNCSLKYKEEFPKGHQVIKNNKLLCVRCEQYKEFEDFYDTGHTTPNNIRMNKMTNCKECHILIGKEQRYKRIKTIEGTLKELLKRSRNCKKGKEKVCDLDLKFLLSLYDNQQGKCALSGINLETATFYNPRGISIDRIDSDVGYIKGNIQLVCWVVNQMKNNLSNEELIQWSNYIVNHNESQK